MAEDNSVTGTMRQQGKGNEGGKITEQQPWASGLFQLLGGGITVESCPER